MATYKRFLGKVGIVALAVVLSVVALTSHQNKHVFGAANGRIAFSALDGTAPQIFTMNPDGSDRQQLTFGSTISGEPVWSPTGSKIAYIGVPDGASSSQIFVMSLSGSHSVGLTNDDSINFSDPAWSPDGTKIAFVYDDGVVGSAIYVMNADGTNQTAVTTATGNTSPDWSPDGTQLAYVCGNQICVSNADGTNEQNITNDSNYYDGPAWSPDGTKIAYAVSNNPYDHNLGIMNADGSSKHNLLTSANFDNTDVSWSPDGTKLLYSGQATSFVQLFTANPDGSNETAITSDSEYSFLPSWQPIVDTDGDGLFNSSEALAPNNGDANGDGISDEMQPQVTAVINPLTNSYNVLQSNCTTNTGVSVGALPTAYKDSGFTYTQGLLNFTLTCPTHGTTAIVSVYYYGLQDSASLLLRKYTTATHTYQTIPGVTVSAVTIGDQTLTKATYQITDGSALDQDGTANGIIVDPVGIATPNAGAPNTGLGGMAQ